MKRNREKRTDLKWHERLLFALGGIYAVVYGYGQLLRGRWIYTNWKGQDVTATFVMVLGVLFILAAIFPWGRLKFLWNTDDREGRR